MTDIRPRSQCVPTPVERRLIYTVVADLPDELSAARYLEWLLGGHTQLVLAGGAQDATVTRLTDPPPEPGRVRVESRYTFPDREAFDRYVREYAPALRADGLGRFGPHTGVRMTRTTGEIVGSVIRTGPPQGT